MPPARRFYGYGRVFDSELDLPELDEARSDARVDFRIRGPFVGSVPSADAELFPHAFLASDEAWLRYRYDRHGHVLLFPRQAWFELLDDGREVRAHARPGLSEVALRHLLLNQVIPLAISLQLVPVLHASAVVTPHGAIAFMGRSGRGKSTTAAHLARSGWPLLTDDGLVLGVQAHGFEAIPSYPAVGLWPDSSARLLGDVLLEAREGSEQDPKKRLRLPESIPFQREPSKLCAVFLIVRADDSLETPRFERVTGPEATIMLLEHAYRLELREGSRHAADFAWQSELASRVPVVKFQFASRLDALRHLRPALERLLETLRG